MDEKEFKQVYEEDVKKYPDVNDSNFNAINEIRKGMGQTEFTREEFDKLRLVAPSKIHKESKVTRLRKRIGYFLIDG